MTNQDAKEMFSLSTPMPPEAPQVVASQVVVARPETLGGYIDAFGGLSLLAVVALLVVAIVAYQFGKRRAPTSGPESPVLVTTNWWAVFKLYSVQGGAVIAAISGWYAAFPAAQAMISATAFAGFIAFANLFVIVLRNLNQKSDI